MCTTSAWSASNASGWGAAPPAARWSAAWRAASLTLTSRGAPRATKVAAMDAATAAASRPPQRR